jgi:hypothetical protein
MPTYRYVVKDKLGKIHRDHIEASDEGAAKAQLQADGYWVTQLTLVPEQSLTTKHAFITESAKDDHHVFITEPAKEDRTQTQQIYKVIALFVVAALAWYFLRL